jgi:hypothetical protein
VGGGGGGQERTGGGERAQAGWAGGWCWLVFHGCLSSARAEEAGVGLGLGICSLTNRATEPNGRPGEFKAEGGPRVSHCKEPNHRTERASVGPPPVKPTEGNEENKVLKDRVSAGGLWRAE